MLADLFYLSAIWLVLSFILVLLFGTRVKHSDPITSVLYLALILGIGDSIALWWLQEPFDLLIGASVVAFIFGVIWIWLLHDWNAFGQAAWLFSLTTTIAYLVYAFAVTALAPISSIAFVFSFLLFLLETAALTLSLTYAFEVFDVMCRVRWHHQAQPVTPGTFTPKVSLHVPAYNEPPELVEKTLRALKQLDYPDYEVILVDNNTPDEGTWQPLAKICNELGFKCLHLEKWPGYKSGALNFALAMTDPNAGIIGVIDADYIIQPDFLKRIVPYFADPEIAFVQTPQDYRDWEQSHFFQAAYDGYRYFFSLSMPARNERNAIIFCGTMGLLRKQVLQEIGGWDEWCITEDAEASLRILNRGYKSLFVNETFGRGLMPLDFEGLKKQRFRWAFGGVQVLKKHWNKLMPWSHWVDPENKMTGVQRYFYLTAGLQWFNELLTFTFTLMVIVSAALSITNHTAFLRPTTHALVILPIVLIGTNMLRALWGLRNALNIGWRRAVYAMTGWFSLTWVVALACVQAIVRERGVFLRTPKTLTDSAVARALRVTSFETMVGVLCVLAGLGVIIHAPSVLTLGLMILCFSQAFIYLSAPFHSLMSATSRPHGVAEGDRADIAAGNVARESRLGTQLALAALGIVVVVFLASLLPAPTANPTKYVGVNPQPLLTPQAKPTIQLPISIPLIPTNTPVEVTPTLAATPLGPTFTPAATIVVTASPIATASPVVTVSVTGTPPPSPTLIPTTFPTATPVVPTPTALVPTPTAFVPTPTALVPTPPPPTSAPTTAPTSAPTEVPPTSAPPTSAPPTTAPTSAPPTSAPPTSAPTSAPPTSAPPTAAPQPTAAPPATP